MKKVYLDMELLFLGFMIFLFAPLEMFFSNINDFWFTVYDFIGYLIIAFVVYVGISYSIKLILVCRMPLFWEILVYYIFLIGLALYIQGNFFLVDYGQLDGQPINWSEFRIEGIISVCLFVTIIVVGTLLLKKNGVEKIRKVTKAISVCLILIQVSTLIAVSVLSNGFTKKEEYVVTSKNEWIYSQEGNFNILVLDSFDSRVFDNLLNNECKDEIEALLDDFTYYRNTTAVYPYTDYSIPQMITGEEYLNKEVYGDYLNHSYRDSPLINELQRNNYEINIYQYVEIPNGDIVSKIDNWEKTRLLVSSHKRLLGYIYKLVGFRYLPQPLKKLCWIYPDDIDDMQIINYVNEKGLLSDEDVVDSYSWQNKLFYESIENLSVKKGGGKVFHFYHLKGLHHTRNLDKDFNDAEDVSLEETAKAMFTLLERYLNKLKEEGIYDNSIIMVMADHGSDDYPGIKFKQSPLLLIKGMEEHHPFVVTDIPVSYSDLQVGYCNLINQTNTDNIFEIRDKNRERYLYRTEYFGRALNSDDYGTEFEKCIIYGHAFDSDSIITTGQVFSCDSR